MRTIEDLVRADHRPWLKLPLRLIRALMRAIRRKLSRALGFVTAAISTPARRIKTVLRMIAQDRGFGFWWLAAMAAITLAVGLLVGVLLSPVIGLLAALIAGIWMLARRASQRRRTNCAAQGG